MNRCVGMQKRELEEKTDGVPIDEGARLTNAGLPFAL